MAQRLDYPLLSDKNGTMRKAFGIELKARVVSAMQCRALRKDLIRSNQMASLCLQKDLLDEGPVLWLCCMIFCQKLHLCTP